MALFFEDFRNDFAILSVLFEACNRRGKVYFHVINFIYNAYYLQVVDSHIESYLLFKPVIIIIMGEQIEVRDVKAFLDLMLAPDGLERSYGDDATE